MKKQKPRNKPHTKMLGAPSANMAKVFISFTPQIDAHCLNITKGGKDSKAFQNSLLIFFVVDNKVLLCFFSVKY